MAKKLCGWMGTILKVDLTSGEVAKEPLSEDMGRDFIGGRGFGAKILYDETGPNTDPLASDNRLIINAGPAAGTLGITAGKGDAQFRSPLTGVLGYSSFGGYFSPELKYAGYDCLIIKGRAWHPVYLWIDNDEVEIRDARHLWGKWISETTAMLKEEIGDDRIRALLIGPAGEKLVRFACGITDTGNAAGRCGCGAVMGSKNLKAIVVRGTKSIRIANPDKLFRITEETTNELKSYPAYSRMHDYGTTTLIAEQGGSGCLPVRNYQFSTAPAERLKPLHHEYIFANYPHRHKSNCQGCPIRCHAWVNIDARYGRFAATGSRPEGGTLTQGADTEVYNYPAMVKFNTLCDEYGLDTYSTSGLIGMAMEWYEKGIITKKDTDGLEIGFGNADALIELTEKIVKREGFGNILAQGDAQAGKIVGAPPETITTGKGLHYSVVHGAGFAEIALGYSVDPRGTDHLYGINPMSWGIPGSSRWIKYYEERGIPQDYAETHPLKADVVINYQREMMLANLLGTCIFSGCFWVGYERPEGDYPYYSDLLSAVTGIEYSREDLIQAAERAINLHKAYNVRLGLGRKEDTPSGRYMEPAHGGAADGRAIDPQAYDRMLDRYYEVHGWDIKTGIPTRDTLEKMGLKYVADDLKNRGIL